MPIHYETACALKSVDEPFAYTERDTMLYALGVGMGADPMNRAELPYVYERGLKAMPSQASVAAWGAGRLGEVGINYLMVVHGEQRLTLHRPLPASADLLADWRIVDIIDKGAGKGALVLAEITLKDKKDGQPVCTLGSTVFARADGGFGGPSEGGPAPHPTPERAPDKVAALTTRPDQALLYRLSGDRNPLHSDPDVAAAAGFPRPILHGLCTYGVTCRAILQSYCDYDPDAIAAFDVRFSAPVFPGETITTRMWKEGGVIAFDALVEERGVTVIKNGRCVLR
jgi:acyl dehydratase